MQLEELLQLMAEKGASDLHLKPMRPPLLRLHGKLGPMDGEPLSLELEQSVTQAGGWLPLAALLEGQRGVWTVLRIEPEGDRLRTVREAVEVLDVQGERAYVRGSLIAGAQVVSSGVHRVTPGSLVTPAEEN